MSWSVLSADSHIVEPADFWLRHADPEWADRLPRSTEDADGNVAFLFDGDKRLGSVGAASQAGLRFDAPEDITFEGAWEDVRPGCSEPEPRLADMERDGVIGEVIFPTLGARLYAVARGDLLSACFRAGNSWMMETFGDHSDVFKPVALLNIQDIDESIRELTRCIEGGLAGAGIPTFPGHDHPYNSPDLDRFWAAAQDLGAPLAFHVASCFPGAGQLGIFTGDWEKPDAAAYSSTQDYWVRRSVGSMIFAGVFERFPDLRVTIVEHELSWMPYFLKQMDMHYKELSQTAPHRFAGDTMPSDFFATHIYTTFQEDELGLQVLPDMIGTDTLMFGSDYPHAESTWPNSQMYLDELLGGFDAETQHKFVQGNVARLFGFAT